MVFNQILRKVMYYPFLWSIRQPKIQGGVEYGPDSINRIMEDLNKFGIETTNLTIDIDKYNKYFEDAKYTYLYPAYYSDNIFEKILEHFIAIEILCLEAKDVYIDIASENSPVPEIYNRLFGCNTYRQDLSYPEGIHGDRIGGNAAKMPIPDEFASKMGLHCSFEHFEGRSDIEFIKEVSRVLKPGGKCCIVPLYLFDQYAIQTDPVSSTGKVRFDPDAVVYCAKNWGNRHGRFYDVKHLKSRIIDNIGDMSFTLYYVSNATSVHDSCYVKFALILKK